MATVKETVESGIKPITLDFSEVKFFESNKRIVRSFITVNSLDLGVLGYAQYRFVARRTKVGNHLVRRHLEKLFRLIPSLLEQNPDIECFTVPVYARLLSESELASMLVDMISLYPEVPAARICIELSADMLMMAGKGTKEECIRLSEDAISSGRALDVFRRSIAQQGGDIRFTEDYSVLGEAKKKHVVYSLRDGYISGMDSEEIGLASLALGAGRKTKEAPVDYTAGIMLEKEYGDYVKKGEKLMTLFTSSECSMEQTEEKVLSALKISDTAPPERSIVIKVIE
jgi:hypothetical protein